jgi:transposase
VQGHSTVQVAAEMGVGYETAKTFLRRVRAKYAAVDRPAGKRSELITRAEEDGIL